MSAVFKALEAQFEPMTPARLDEVVAIEQTAYAHPWAHNHLAGHGNRPFHNVVHAKDGALWWV